MSNEVSSSMTNVVDLDFDIVSERWTKFRLIPDNTVLGVRIAVTKVLQKESEAGEPGYAVLGQTALSAKVPESLLKKKGDVPVQTGQITSDQVDGGTEMEVKLLGEAEYWQEYRTSNGWIVNVKPVVGRVMRLQTYAEIDNTGLMEPVYWVATSMSIRSQAAVGITGIDSSFKIENEKERLETTNFWAEFKVKKDDWRGDQYVDVLLGKRDEADPHAHIGINFDQSTRFVQSRGVLNTVRREIDSKQRGLLSDETIVYSKPKDGKPEGKLIFQITIDEPTKTITPRFEEARLEEKYGRDSLKPSESGSESG